MIQWAVGEGNLDHHLERSQAGFSHSHSFKFLESINPDTMETFPTDETVFDFVAMMPVTLAAAILCRPSTRFSSGAMWPQITFFPVFFHRFFMGHLSRKPLRDNSLSFFTTWPVVFSIILRACGDYTAFHRRGKAPSLAAFALLAGVRR